MFLLPYCAYCSVLQCSSLAACFNLLLPSASKSPCQPACPLSTASPSAIPCHAKPGCSHPSLSSLCHLHPSPIPFPYNKPSFTQGPVDGDEIPVRLTRLLKGLHSISLVTALSNRMVSKDLIPFTEHFSISSIFLSVVNEEQKVCTHVSTCSWIPTHQLF